MSIRPVREPACAELPARSPVELTIDARPRQIGSFAVARLLPSVARRLVGPVIFFDHMGPATFGPDDGLDVAPHPHIGLATVTYLFEGEIIHRDSLGSHQAIVPGDVNWMTAGRGVVHSERTRPERRGGGERLDGVQLWVALPTAHEETEPAFHHHPADTLPTLESDGATIRVLAGRAFGATSPVATFSPLVYADVALRPGARLPLPAAHAERAVYVASGAVEIAGELEAAGRMVVLARGAEVVVRSAEGARVMLVGGDPLDGPRHVVWNFVSSSRERIEQAKADWRADRFPRVPGDEERIPLPE